MASARLLLPWLSSSRTLYNIVDVNRLFIIIECTQITIFIIVYLCRGKVRLGVDLKWTAVVKNMKRVESGGR